MNIGIITWFEHENYGTKLQAVALQFYLKKHGYNVQLINFVTPDEKKLKKPTFQQKIKNKFNYLALKHAKGIYADELTLRSHRMKQVISDLCVCTQKAMDDRAYIHLCSQFDLLIFGSDQIWNPNWYHPYYYADFPEIHTRKVSYAPSMGIREMPENVKELIRGSLKAFDVVTVREERAADLLEPLMTYRPQKVLDPTLLLDKSTWEGIFDLQDKKSKPYILCYFLSDNKNHWAAAQKFAKNKSLDVRIIPQSEFSFFQKGTICADAGIKEFLELIRNAEYVLTDSFHGTIFSILLEKEFYLFERFKQDKYSSQNDRVLELVKQFDVEERLLSYNSNKVTIRQTIDYNKVKNTLEQWRNHSTQILFSAIEARKEEHAE